MRTTDERIAELHKRAGQMKRESRRRRVSVAQLGSAAVCIIAVVALALAMPDIGGSLAGGMVGGTFDSTSDVAASGMHGSIFTDSNHLGYVVVGIVAFLLGIALTMFSFSLKRWQRDRDREDESL